MKRTQIKRGNKPMRKRSPKRASYMASQARQDGLAHMGRVKALPCIVCSAPPPSSAHHCTGDKLPRDDLRTIPLCYECHQGQNGYHAAKRTWVAKNGPDYEFLPRVNFLLYGIYRLRPNATRARTVSGTHERKRYDHPILH